MQFSAATRNGRLLNQLNSWFVFVFFASYMSWAPVWRRGWMCCALWLWIVSISICTKAEFSFKCLSFVLRRWTNGKRWHQERLQNDFARSSTLPATTNFPSTHSRRFYSSSCNRRWLYSPHSVRLHRFLLVFPLEFVLTFFFLIFQASSDLLFIRKRDLGDRKTM